MSLVGGHHGAGGLDIWSYIARLGVQMRGAGDDFFAEGDSVCAMRSCQYMTQVDIEALLHKDYETFPCQVPGCKATFKQLIDSEAHYNTKHRHVCSQCKKSLPSAHLLDLHIVETHDTYFQLLSAKRPSFECFVENCTDKFWTAANRREHCIGIHSFPKDFKFDPLRNTKAASASPEAVKKRVKKKSSSSTAKHPRRPASVYVAPMEVDTLPAADSVIIPPITKSKLPVLNRRLSLNNTKDTPATPREPLSLAKMGQRLTAKSTFDISNNNPMETNSMTTPPRRRLSGIPTPARGMSVKKMNSTSSTATTVSSPDRSLTASPTKSRSTVSMNNNSGSSLRDDLNGNSSPNKSRIPVLRSPSCKVPRNVCFGKSSQKAFDLKPWYHAMHGRSTRPMEESNFERDLKMALDD